MAKKRTPIQTWQKEDAGRLLSLYETAMKGMTPKPSQEVFGDKYGIGSQGMVWQYLHGETPLHLVAASKFAIGIGCRLEEISPTLAKQACEFVMPVLDRPQKVGKIHPQKVALPEEKAPQTDRRYESLQPDELELLQNYRKLREIGDGASKLLSNAKWLLSEALRGRSGADIVPITRGSPKKTK